MKINPYLNFDGDAEVAFNFYKSVFGGEFIALMKMSEAPEAEKLPKQEQNRIMHISLPIGKDTILMASDIMPSMGQTLKKEIPIIFPYIRQAKKRQTDSLMDYQREGKSKCQWKINFGEIILGVLLINLASIGW